MYYAVTKQHIKDWLNITDTSQDDFVETLQELVTGIIENYIKKYVVTRHISEEFLDGKGGSNISVKQYPIYKLVSIYDDPDHDFDSATLLDSDNYVINYRTGKITLVNEESAFNQGENNIKVDYWAGYSRYLVSSGNNDKLYIKESGGSTVTVTIPEQTSYDYTGYSAEDLASAIETALNNESSLSGTYTISYNHETQKFKIESTVDFQLMFGTNTDASIASLLGFNETDDSSAASSRSSDYPVNGVSGDIITAGMQIALMLWEQSKKGTGLQMIKKRVLASGGGGTYEYITDQLPPIAKQILDLKRRIYL